MRLNASLISCILMQLFIEFPSISSALSYTFNFDPFRCQRSPQRTDGDRESRKSVQDATVLFTGLSVSSVIVPLTRCYSLEEGNALYSHLQTLLNTLLLVLTLDPVGNDERELEINCRLKFVSLSQDPRRCNVTQKHSERILML